MLLSSDCVLLWLLLIELYQQSYTYLILGFYTDLCILMFKHTRFFLFFFCCLVAHTGNACASDSLTHQERKTLAGSFLVKMKERFSEVDRLLSGAATDVPENVLEDGAQLLLQPVLQKALRVDGVVMGVYRDGAMWVSLRDFVSALNYAIDVDAQGQSASGWYLREDRVFDLSVSGNEVQTHMGTFGVEKFTFIEGADIFVRLDSLNLWMDMDSKIDISLQELHVQTDLIHPLLAKIGRKNFKLRSYKVPDPSLPSVDEGYELASAPVVDVSTVSNYRKRSDAKGVDAHSANIRTVHDFAKGTLTSNLQLNDRDKLNFARVNYKQESVSPDLLGPLKARRFEVGDVSAVNLPVSGGSGQNVGVRVTNTSPVRNFSTPTTSISGAGISGWDVELYRDDVLLSVQEVGEDGYYEFTNIDLYLEDNDFRLVFYGPQGEVREEDVYVPVDRNLLSRNDGVYDVSLALKGRNSYRKNRADDIDNDTLSLSALYEKPLSDRVTGVIGLRSEENEGERDSVVNLGVSANVAQTLLNADLAADDEGEVAANLVARKNFGKHETRVDFNYSMAGFDTFDNSSNSFSNVSSSGGVDFYSVGAQANGFLYQGQKTRLGYSLSSDYSWDSNGDDRLLSTAGFSAGIPYMNVNGLLRYSSGSSLSEDVIDASASVSGRALGNRLRLSANYDVKPEGELNSVTASLNRRVNKDVDVDFSVVQRPQNSLTEYQARLDWQAGFIRISPSIRYNSESDFFAGLNTRFGFLKDPSDGKVRFYDENLTSRGLVSAYVFLDHDGDGKFGDGDEPLPDVMVRAPQSGHRVRTDENGVALFHRLQLLKLTDIYVDGETLQDPTWISGFEGVSVYPREGYVAQVDFPVHVSGEIDGTLYANVVGSDIDGVKPQPVVFRNVRLNLYNDNGEVEVSTKTDGTGFYYFSQVPPGRYFLMIDEESARSSKIIRPEPQKIEIGYDGTVIYANDIYVDAGAGDVPSVILSDLDAYKEMHPHVDFSNSYELVLNLGEFNSRLLMSVVWYKLQTRYAPMLRGADLFVSPAESYASIQTGKHVLRVGVPGSDVSDAYSRCRALTARDQYCQVEIYPSAMKQARADTF